MKQISDWMFEALLQCLARAVLAASQQSLKQPKCTQLCSLPHLFNKHAKFYKSFIVARLDATLAPSSRWDGDRSNQHTIQKNAGG